ncbi:MAG: glycosyltransferase family 9 protein [Nitrospirae bacterium]|nr:glycosyltransferase family 9 protein [Nitrospirota bacterium]
MHSITNPEDIREILVIRLNKIGDMICTMPLIKTLKHNFKNARITVLGEEPSREILENNRFVDSFIIYKKPDTPFRNKYIQCWRLLMNYKKQFNIKKFDMAIGVKGGFSSFLAVITFLSRAALRIGYSNPQRHPLNLCYNLPGQPIDCSRLHQVDACLNLLKPLGIKDVIKDITIDIPPPSKDSAFKFLYSNGLEANKRLTVFNISNNRETSKWQLENFIELGKALFKRYNYKCIITCTASDKADAMRVCDEMKDIGFFYETKKLMDFAAIASMANFLVAGDGGAVHIGAAAGTKVVALFGQTNPVIYGPYGSQHIVLKAPDIDVRSIKVEDVLSVIKSKGLPA